MCFFFFSAFSLHLIFCVLKYIHIKIFTVKLFALFSWHNILDVKSDVSEQQDVSLSRPHFQTCNVSVVIWSHV